MGRLTPLAGNLGWHGYATLKYWMCRDAWSRSAFWCPFSRGGGVIATPTSVGRQAFEAKELTVCRSETQPYGVCERMPAIARTFVKPIRTDMAISLPVSVIVLVRMTILVSYCLFTPCMLASRKVCTSHSRYMTRRPDLNQGRSYLRDARQHAKVCTLTPRISAVCWGVRVFGNMKDLITFKKANRNQRQFAFGGLYWSVPIL